MREPVLLQPVKLPKPNEPCWCGSKQKYKRCHQRQDAASASTAAERAEAHRVRPGRISPRRPVPDHIPRPDYALTGRPPRSRTREILTPEELPRMRRACRAAAEVLQETAAAIRPGITTDELDAIAHEAYIKRGGYPSTLNYNGFKKSICSSVNEVICHGIPDDRPLQDGDIVNLDVTIFLEGMHGDCNATFLVGNVDPESRRLVQITRECLDLGIAAVKPGRPISDIGRAIEAHATRAGFSVVRAYCGHGIGKVFHTSLQIPHYFDRSMRTIMEPGMTFTIEPMINAGTFEAEIWDDDWTAVTADGKRSAQFEHTILVTDEGAEILTLP
jgi:methionyl aminopeptidase